MPSTTYNYITNLWRLLRGKRLLAPLVVSYYPTTHCNLNCAYCEDFGARRNPEQPAPLPLESAKQVLSIIRQATSHLLLTGGEPLLYPDIETLVAYAKETLRYHNVMMISNSTLLHQHIDVLQHLDHLIISLDTLDEELWDKTLRAEPGTAHTIIQNIITASRQIKLNRPHTTQIIIHCVITPDTLTAARQVLNFCINHHLLFSFSPQSVNNWPHYDLLAANADYVSFVTEIQHLKHKGAPILGSSRYLRLMHTFDMYGCYPLLAPRVMSDGTLSYPCRPIERAGDEHGGRAINLLEAGDWHTALSAAQALYGDPPMTCGSCYQQCYVEPSLMQAHPLSLLWEYVAFAASRQGSICTYAPG